MENVRELPLGIQDFEKLRTNGCLYVDKTRYVYELTKKHWPYFLGRPRRFGKSLLLSTLKEYFLGKKELFEGFLRYSQKRRRRSSVCVSNGRYQVCKS